MPSQALAAAAFDRDIELYSPRGLALAVLALCAGIALRANLIVQAACVLVAIGALLVTLRRSLRFDRRRLCTRGLELPWSSLLSVRGFRQGGKRLLVLTFRGGVVTASSRMWRFERLAGFIGAGLHRPA